MSRVTGFTVTWEDEDGYHKLSPSQRKVRGSQRVNEGDIIGIGYFERNPDVPGEYLLKRQATREDIATAMRLLADLMKGIPQEG